MALGGVEGQAPHFARVALQQRLAQLIFAWSHGVYDRSTNYPHATIPTLDVLTDQHPRTRCMNQHPGRRLPAAPTCGTITGPTPPPNTDEEGKKPAPSPSSDSPALCRREASRVVCVPGGRVEAMTRGQRRAWISLCLYGRIGGSVMDTTDDSGDQPFQRIRRSSVMDGHTHTRWIVERDE